jgi:hypothetical protein
VGRAAERALEHVSDPLLQDAVGRETDRILDALGFEKLVDIRISEARVGAEVDARDRAAIARQDRLQHALPSIGAVHVAGTQGTAFQIAKLVEHE